MCCRDLIASSGFLIPKQPKRYWCAVKQQTNKASHDQWSWRTVILQGDSNWANYIANAIAKWASGSHTEDCRHKDPLWWLDGRRKRTIGCSCPSKVQTGLGRWPTREISTDYNAKRNLPSFPWPNVSTVMVVFIQKQVRLLVTQRQQCHQWKPKVMIFFSKLAAKRLQNQNVHAR